MFNTPARTIDFRSRVLSSARLSAPLAAFGALALLPAPTHAAPRAAHFPSPRAARLNGPHLRLAARSAHQSAAAAAQKVALAVHQTHLARQNQLALLSRRTAHMQAAGAKRLHARNVALLQSALHQQRLAMVEVKMQTTLTVQAKQMALRQQKTILHQQKMAQVQRRAQIKLAAAQRKAQIKLAAAQRKAQMKMAALRHQSLLRLAKLQDQHEAFGSGNVVMAAYALRGSRYVMGGTSRSGFDCSGFVRYVLSATDGVAVPRTAAEQYYHGLPIPVQKMEPGDLVFFKNTYKRGISHVGIYAGEGKFIHAANAHKGVRMDLLRTPYYWSHFAGARRVLPSVMRQASFLR